MTRTEESALRLDLAQRMGAEPHHWIATREAAAELAAGDTLPGIPLTEAETGWGLELVLSPRAR